MAENRIIAKVNGREITQEDVFKFLKEIDPNVAMQFNTPEGVKKIIDELINQELMYLDAKENNIDEEQEYKDLLEESQRALLKSYALNRLISTVSSDEEELIKYYEEHKEHFKQPETRVASHILVDDEEKANTIFKELKNGLKFEEAANKYSTCPSKDNGGKLEEFARGQLVPEFEDYAFSMELGEVSQPVKTQFGYHIIRLEDKKEEGQKTFEEVKDEVQTQLIRLKQQDIYLKKIEELSKKYKVEKFS